MQDILDVKRAGGGYRLLVRWEGNNPATNQPWPEGPDSWEPRSNLKRVEKNDATLASKIQALIDGQRAP